MKTPMTEPNTERFYSKLVARSKSLIEKNFEFLSNRVVDVDGKIGILHRKKDEVS